MTLPAASGPTALRRFRPGDLAAFQAYRTDPDIARLQSWDRMTDDAAAAFLRANERCGLLRAGEWTQVAVALTEDGALIGDVGLFLSLDAGTAELGITLAPDHHHRGHAIRAMRLAAGLVWNGSRARRIRAYADPRNRASLQLLRRLGMAHVGQDDGDEAFEWTR
jgi:aminoglycoside 6'-N-acetyltransferase